MSTDSHASSARVLIVEDNQDVSRLVQLALRATIPGIRVEVVDNGVDALQRLTDDADYALAVCDIMMPRMDGSRLVRELAEHPLAKNIPVVLVSGVEPGRIEDARRSPNVIASLRKPVDPMELARRVSRLLAGGRF